MADMSYDERIARITPDAIREMSPEQAGNKLARLTASYERSQAPIANDAQSQLDRFTSDPAVGERLFRGDAATLQEFHRLAQAVADGDGTDRLVEAIKGNSFPDSAGIETTVAGSLTTRNTVDAVNALRESGLNDGAIGEAFSGRDIRTGEKFAPDVVAQAGALRAQRMLIPNGRNASSPVAMQSARSWRT
jgi:hypothetical protein